MWLVVGLGNPGPEYSKTRHNIGFQVIDNFSERLKISHWSHKFKGDFAKCTFENHEVIILKPQTFMNLSGECVQPFMQYFKIPLPHLIVAHDELDIDFGKIRIQKNRGHGGHNGIRSLQGLLNTKDFLRIKMGVGKPSPVHLESESKEPLNSNIANYVLSPFTKMESQKLSEFIQSGTSSIETIILQGPERAATLFNAS